MVRPKRMIGLPLRLTMWTPSTCWMMGAGIKGGVSYGATDQFGRRAEVDPTTVWDFYATVLYLRAEGGRLQLARIEIEVGQIPEALARREELGGPLPFRNREAPALPAPELEDAGLALLTDQLEDVGDSEVLEIPAQRHRHGLGIMADLGPPRVLGPRAHDLR